MMNNWRLEFVVVAGLVLLVVSMTKSGQLAGFWKEIWG